MVLVIGDIEDATENRAGGRQFARVMETRWTEVVFSKSFAGVLTSDDYSSTYLM